MAKRDGKTILLGSGDSYLMEFANSMPTREQLFIEANRAGYTKGGAALSYEETTQMETDDQGYVSKIITTDEKAKLKLGLITWNATTIDKVVDRAKVTESNGIRTAKIGGKGNEKGKYYVAGFHHHDEKDGDVWVRIMGRNEAGLNLTFGKDGATLVEPEFTALPHDTDGTLIIYDEEIPVASGNSPT
jgi:hypothetical protein